MEVNCCFGVFASLTGIDLYFARYLFYYCLMYGNEDILWLIFFCQGFILFWNENIVGLGRDLIRIDYNFAGEIWKVVILLFVRHTGSLHTMSVSWHVCCSTNCDDALNYLQPGYLPPRSGKERLPPIA